MSARRRVCGTISNAGDDAISRRDFAKLAAGGAAAVALGCTRERESMTAPSRDRRASREHPNLVIVFPDQMRAHAVGFMGEDPVITPNLDRFASEGLALTQAASSYPVCSPARAMLMSGRYAIANKVTGNCTNLTAPHGCELQETDRCWSDVLADEGYSLGYIGKWHLDSPHEPYIDCGNNRGKVKWNEWCPPNRRHGFDFWHSYGTYDAHNRPMYWRTDAPRDGFHYVDQWGPEHEADLAIKYIRNEGGGYRKSDRPFAMVVGNNPPHSDYRQVPKKYVDRYAGVSTEDLCNRPNIPPAGTKWGDYYRRNVRNYFAQVTGVDDQFGRIMRALGEAGIEKDTIVIFTADHGNCLGIHDMVSKNNWYEESMRVPFLIRWPGKIAARRDDLLLSLADVYPTLMELMGFAEATPESVEGTSHAGLFLTGEGERPTSQLYMRPIPDNTPFGRRGIRTHRYTLMIEQVPDKPERTVLYDRERDPYEMENIAEANPDIVAKLVETELVPWLRKTGDPWLKRVEG